MYFIDSYLGYFGKEIIEGNAASGGGLQDIILLVALGVSVLIGVFASQLAGETWESISEEIEADKQKKKELSQEDEEEDDGILRSLFGFELPLWVVGAQVSLKEAEVRMDDMIQTEFKAAVWNCTDDNPPPIDKDPSKFNDSPETIGAGKGFEVLASVCDGMALSPCLIKAYFKYADPIADFTEDGVDVKMKLDENPGADNTPTIVLEENKASINRSEDNLLRLLQVLRESELKKLNRIEKELVKTQKNE